MRLKIKTQDGAYYFWYARRMWPFSSLTTAIHAANALAWHSVEIRINIYAENGITLHA